MPPVMLSHPYRLGLFPEHWRSPHQSHSTGRFPRDISVCIAAAWVPLHADLHVNQAVVRSMERDVQARFGLVLFWPCPACLSSATTVWLHVGVSPPVLCVPRT